MLIGNENDPDDDISFFQAGEERLTIYNGNVGIGTTTPGAKLEVAGQIKITGGSPGAGKVLTSDASGLASWQTFASLLPAGTDGQTLRHDGTTWVANSVLFNNGTNVGIGTTTPQTKLDVYQAGTTGWAGRIIVRNENVAPLMGVYNNVAMIGAHNASLTAWSPLYLNTDNTLGTYGNVIIGGNVGIGTTNPGTWYGQPVKLDVASGYVAIGGLRIGGKTSAEGTAGVNVIYQDENIGISTGGVGKHIFLNPSGNVGIGTTTPGAKLEVAGQIKITGGSPGAGKVLTSDASGLASWQTFASLLPAGTNGQTLRHDGTTWVANSVLFNNGTNVGIGTTTPQTKLDVYQAGTTGWAGRNYCQK